MSTSSRACSWDNDSVSIVAAMRIPAKPPIRSKRTRIGSPMAKKRREWRHQTSPFSGWRIFGDTYLYSNLGPAFANGPLLQASDAELLPGRNISDVSSILKTRSGPELIPQRNVPDKASLLGGSAADLHGHHIERMIRDAGVDVDASRCRSRRACSLSCGQAAGPDRAQGHHRRRRGPS